MEDSKRKGKNEVINMCGANKQNKADVRNADFERRPFVTLHHFTVVQPKS